MSSDRELPQDTAAEQGTLGAMLLEPGAAEIALGIVSPRDFYREAHQLVAGAAQAVLERGEPVDLLTVAGELRNRGWLEQTGGGEYLTALINKVPTAAHVRRYANIVAGKAMLREIITSAQRVAETAHGEQEDPAQVAMAAAETFQTLYRRRVQATAESASEHAHRAYADFERMFAGDTEAHVNTGIREFDRRIGGLDMQRLVVLKADSKHGKSSLARQTAVAAARAAVGTDRRVLCVSLEDSDALYRGKLLAHMGWLDSMALLIPGRFQELYGDQAGPVERWVNARDELEQLPMDLQFGLRDCEQLVGMIGQWAQKCKPALVVVDYFQLLEDEHSHRTEEQGLKHRAGHLSKLANELECPVLTPSQVTYNQGTRTWDAKGARALEHEASMVLHLIMGRNPETDQITGTGTLSCQLSRITPSSGKVALRAWMQYGRFLDTVDAASLEAAERQGGDGR